MPLKRISRWTILLIVALLLIAAFLPDLVGVGWHVLHGNSARYRGWDIPVPAGWFAVNHGESLAVERMLRLAIWRDAPTVVFLPLHVTSRFVFDRNVWEQEQIKIQVVRGYRLLRALDVLAVGQTGYCWEFAGKQDAARMWITCIVPAERLSADFSGNRAYVAAFYAILPRITRDQRSP